ncbi:MAG: hypothetical protein JEZ05_04160 [Tenericutes bacterium]|nr:hypothetical protein [Mycoplasmatota bacterium]
MNCNIKRVATLFMLLIFVFTLSACDILTSEALVITTDALATTTESTEYVITWKNYDGSILEIDNNVSYGSIPYYSGQTPVREETYDYRYIFIGWSPDIQNVTQNQVYTALFISVQNVTNININASNWGNYFGFSIKLNNINQNSYTSIIREQLTFTYIPRFIANNSNQSKNVTVSGYVYVQIGYTTDNYSNIEFTDYKVYFTHIIYENLGYYSTISVSLYHNIGTSLYSTDSWVVNVEAYLTSMSGTISIS